MKTELFPIIKFYGNVDSTNEIARAWLSSKKRDQNAVIVAEKQNFGKGRGIRQWYSPKGGLWFTMVFHDQILPPSVTLFTGVIIHTILKERFSHIDFFLKWPNDILIVNKKVCGILTFTSKNATCVGVGINCNLKNFPNNLSQLATSLYIETGKKVKLKGLLSDLLTKFSSSINEFTTLGFMPFREYFESFHLLTGKKVAIQLADNTTIGEVKEVSNTGMLVLNVENGIKEFFTADKIDILS